ncbi:MAG TPA: LLM class flavin-dependent oxidoreductase [Solirubrobacteraceae bacterium]|jgi:alkanesulfonate monooxygenase SsuD/methylene tetrahydromethanopterin reductase-like flavin-dependent oxidoreductase (luciferase family)
MKRGLFVAPFGELADVRVLAELAAVGEAAGYDGFFVWDHVQYSPPTLEVADPWVALTAVALATERVTIGPLVTPLARRRPQKLARETITLDRLSGGRLVLGAGLGSDNHREFADFGEETDPKARAKLLDDGLATLARYWDEFAPGPVQRPRIPVWIAARWPNRRPVRRAARWDGLFPIDLPGPEALAELREEVDGDLIVTNEAGTDPQPWAEAGATWCLTGFGKDPTRAAVQAAIDAGP